MNLHVIILLVVAIAALIGFMYFGIKHAQEVDENDRPVIKFQPRNVTDFSKETIGTDPIAKPKRRYKKRNKKKPTVVNNAPVEKRPVGRPKISK